MTTVGVDVAPISSIPDLHCVVPRARGDTRTIERPGHTIHSVGMVVVGIDMAAISGVPQLHRLITARRGDARAIGGPGHGIHDTGMAVVGVGQAWRRGEYPPGDNPATCHYCSCQAYQNGAS